MQHVVGHPWLLRATELGFDSVTGVDLNKNSILVDRVKRKGLNYYHMIWPIRFR